VGRVCGYQPSGAYWSQDSQRIYFRWKQADEPRLKEMSLYVINRDGSGLRRLSDEEARAGAAGNRRLSKDKTMTVFTDEGDIFIYDHAKQARRQITRQPMPKQTRASRSIRKHLLHANRIIST
jgi:Tol biopolymer transport system component